MLVHTKQQLATQTNEMHTKNVYFCSDVPMRFGVFAVVVEISTIFTKYYRGTDDTIARNCKLKFSLFDREHQNNFARPSIISIMLFVRSAVVE